MFVKEITDLTITSPVAEGLFHQITGDYFGRDESFLATVRILMHNRIPKDDSIRIQYTTSRHSKSDIESAKAKDVIRAFMRNSEINRGGKGILLIHSLNGRDEDNEAAVQLIEQNGLSTAYTGYTHLKDITAFFKQNGRINVFVFVNEEEKNTIIFVDRMTIKKWHFIQALTPRYFPWYMKDRPLTPEETALLSTLTKRYAPDYEERVENFASQFDFRTEDLKNRLKGFETLFEREHLRDVRRHIENLNNQISELENSFSRLYRDIEDYRTQELGLVEKIRDGHGDESCEILEYFLCNKSLDLLDVSGGCVRFIVKTFLTNFDPDMFDRIIEKPKSFFYRHYETGKSYGCKEMTDERIKRLMIEVFRKETMKIRVCAVYELDFKNGRYSGLQHYTYPDKILSGYTPNQHIQTYGCLGNNRPIIERAVLHHDYVGAISACCASATNINFSESNTGTYFMEKIFAEDAGKIIQMPDGTNKTPLDAVKWLEEQDGKEKEKEEVVPHE